MTRIARIRTDFSPIVPIYGYSLKTFPLSLLAATLSKWVPRVFDTIIPLNVKTAESADFNASVNTLKQKYGNVTAFNDYQNLTKEFLKYV